MSEDKHVACVAGGDTKEGKADNTVKEGKADNTVKEGKADNTVKEGKADNTVKEGKADNTVKEGKADNTVKEGKADNTVKEGKADNTVKEGKADNIVKEGKAEVFSPPHVFYNPVQEFNRDLTIAVVSEFAKEHFSKLPVETGVNGAVSNDVAGKSNGHELLDKGRIDPANVTKTSEMQADELSQWKRGQYHANGIRVLEGLAATGLRSVRFALELPGVKEIVCNDFDETAFAYIKKNCAHNKVEHLLTPSYADAAAVMYQNKRRHDRFDVIDLDPYGSPVTFLDSAVQAVKDGGLLCVTCTDMGVLCGNASETCYSKYGSVSLRTKYCHEMAVRIVLRCIDSHANRYSRYIVPVLSLSIDFYVRVFVKVYFGQSKVKQSLSKTSLVHHCSGCGAFVLQPMGMCSKTDGGGVKYSPAAGPTVSPRCAHCGFTQHLAGPIWSDPIHDVEFVQKVLAGVEADPARFRTSARITGMLTVVTEELPHVPLYYITDDLCRIVHCTAPRFIQMRSALLHAGYRVSMSHAQPNSLKTDAPNHVIWDIIRCWTKENPVNEKRLKEGAPAHAILAAESGIKADFSLHPEANPKSREKGLLRWQANPERDWGPMPRAKLGEMKTLEERRLEGIHKSRMRREKRKARSGGESTEKRPKGDTDTCGKMEEGASEGSQPPPEGNQPQQN